MRGFRHWKWHLDEMFVKINGETHYLWRAVDHEGEILVSYVTKTRDKKAAMRGAWCRAEMSRKCAQANNCSLVGGRKPAEMPHCHCE